MRCGRVSSREAERATREMVSTNGAAGTVSAPDSAGSGSFGKSSSGRVRRWNFAEPEITSTSCSEERYSSETESFGSERATSRSRRPGTTTAPSAPISASSAARIPRSVSVACSSALPSSSRIRTPASVWMALRVEAARATTES